MIRKTCDVQNFLHPRPHHLDHYDQTMTQNTNQILMYQIKCLTIKLLDQQPFILSSQHINNCTKKGLSILTNLIVLPLEGVFK